MHVNDLLKIAVDSGASDLHLKVGSDPMMRVNGTLRPMNRGPIDDEEMVRLCSVRCPHMSEITLDPTRPEIVWAGTGAERCAADIARVGWQLHDACQALRRDAAGG